MLTILMAGAANGSVILAGNGADNSIVGGMEITSLWGGQGNDNDTLVGGAGHNVYYFA